MASLLEEQIKLEQSQRMRYQSELQLELARHRNAILEKQERAAAAIAAAAEVQRRGQGPELDKEEKDEGETQRRRQIHIQASVEEKTGVNEASAQDDLGADRKNIKSTSTTTTTTKQTPYSTVAASIIDPRYRTMFGYRGPEHPKSTPAELAQLEQERLADLASTFTSSPSSSSLSSSVNGAATRISAESRVQLAMMDYTPSQINSMTPEQANAILHSAQRSNTPQEPSQAQSSPISQHTDVHTSTCAQVGGATKVTTQGTTASGLVEDRRKDGAIDEEAEVEEQQEGGDRVPLQFAPDVMSSLSLKARGIHN
jgi:hypothetical protein